MMLISFWKQETKNVFSMCETFHILSELEPHNEFVKRIIEFRSITFFRAIFKG